MYKVPYTQVDPSVLRGYKFNINDFSSYQVEKLLVSCVQFQGNEACKKKLKDVIYLQRKEKSKYYAYVRNKRMEVQSNELAYRWLNGLHVPKNIISKLVTSPSNLLVVNHTYDIWEPPETEESMIFKKFSHAEALAGLPPGCTQLSGFERLKRSFFPKYFVPDYYFHEKAHVFNLATCLNVLFGSASLVGLLMALPYGRKYVSDFERTSGSNLYESKKDALRARNDAFFRGYSRYMFRWSWRIVFLLGSVVIVSQSLCVYTLKDRMSHYVVGGFFPFGLYKWTRGPKGIFITGTIGSLLFGVPMGFLFGTLEANPRPIWYSAKIQPLVNSPHYWYNWSERKKEESELRLNALLSVLDKKSNPKEVKNSQIYKDLFDCADSTDS